jgi:WD40 repeat protein
LRSKSIFHATPEKEVPLRTATGSSSSKGGPLSSPGLLSAHNSAQKSFAPPVPADKEFVVKSPTHCKNWAHTGYVYCLLSSEHHLVSAGGDGDVKVWSLPEMALAKTANVSDSAILSMQLLENVLIVGCQEGHVKCIDLDLGVVIRSVAAHTSDVMGIVHLPAPWDIMFTASASGSPKRWNSKLECRSFRPDDAEAPPSILCLSRSADYVVSGGNADTGIKIWKPVLPVADVRSSPSDPEHNGDHLAGTAASKERIILLLWVTPSSW